MAFLSDFMMASAAFGAAIYCFVLARRLKALTRLDGGMGGAIALLSAQVDDLTRALAQARAAAGAQNDSLPQLVERAEAAGRRLELLMATMHDLPDGTRARYPDRQGDPGPGNDAAPAGASGGAPSPRHASASSRHGDAHGIDDQVHTGAENTRRGSGAIHSAPRARIVRRRQPTEAV
ncbi:MAG: hypothetical protein JJU19_11315 [Pararhodobacter sp.]|nr:hypothetical protein [Pararhodobacter sp.]